MPLLIPHYECKRCGLYFDTKAKIASHRGMHKRFAKINKLNRKLKSFFKEK